jgi:hypothetical protein
MDAKSCAPMVPPDGESPRGDSSARPPRLNSSASTGRPRGGCGPASHHHASAQRGALSRVALVWSCNTRGYRGIAAGSVRLCPARIGRQRRGARRRGEGSVGEGTPAPLGAPRPPVLIPGLSDTAPWDTPVATSQGGMPLGAPPRAMAVAPIAAQGGPAGPSRPAPWRAARRALAVPDRPPLALRGPSSAPGCPPARTPIPWVRSPYHPLPPVAIKRSAWWPRPVARNRSQYRSNMPRVWNGPPSRSTVHMGSTPEAERRI